MYLLYELKAKLLNGFNHYKSVCIPRTCFIAVRLHRFDVVVDLAVLLLSLCYIILSVMAFSKTLI